jgi:hypothetical protein
MEKWVNYLLARAFSKICELGCSPLRTDLENAACLSARFNVIIFAVWHSTAAREAKLRLF